MKNFKKEKKKSTFDLLEEQGIKLFNFIKDIELVMLGTARTFQSLKKHVSNQTINLNQAKENLKGFSKSLVQNYN